MCVMSMVMDHKYDEWKNIKPLPYVPNPLSPQVYPSLPTPQEIEEFKRLLDRAREYDKKNNEPDCEMQEKKDKLLKLAKELGINIDFI